MNMDRKWTRVAGIAVAATAMLAMSACAASESPSNAGSSTVDTTKDKDLETFSSVDELLAGYPMEEVCGTKDITIAFPTGILNAWMKQSAQMVKDAAAVCPNVKDVIVTDAQVDQQKAVSDVNSLVAQGVDGIVTLPIFGDAQVPSFRSATNAGVPVVTLLSDGVGTVGEDIAQSVVVATSVTGQDWADWLDKHLKKGTVIFLGNAPGQPSSQSAFDSFKTALEAYPDLKLVEDEFVPTNNAAVEKKKAMIGMLAKHGRIDAVVTDNGAIDSAVIEAYEQSNMELPYLANVNTTNGLGCVWNDTPFPLYSDDGGNEVAWRGTYFLLAAINGIEVDQPTSRRPFVSVDTEAGIEPICDESVSPDADWSTGFDSAKMKKVLG